MGEAHFAAGALKEAGDSYQASIAIHEGLLTENPDCLDCKAGLSLSHAGVAEVALKRGDLAGALEQCLAALALREALVAKLPSDTGEQLAVAELHQRLGDVLLLKKDPQGALAAFSKGLTIALRLAQGNPKNAAFTRRAGALAARVKHAGRTR